MKVYITTQGARIIKEGHHLLVKKETTTFHTLFVEKLEQVLIFGNVILTASARRMLMRHGIDTIFFSKDGRYYGRFELPEPKNIMLRQRQFKLIEDQEFALNFVRQVVKGKLQNMITLLQRIKRSRKHQKPGHKANEIKRILSRIDSAASIDSLRGFEGAASAFYFSVFGRGFVKDQGFRRRVRRPPTDPVNSVLSLLYTFLFNRVYAAVRANHLDPYPAFLHALDYGRASLPLDLMEEFRVIISDTLTLSLFNLGILKQDDFITEKNEAHDIAEQQEAQPDVTRDPYGLVSNTDDSADFFDLPPQRVDEGGEVNRQSDGKYPVKLRPEALNKVIENFERKLTTKFYYEPYDRKITYAEALTAQAGQYRKLTEGSLAVYEPILLK